MRHTLRKYLSNRGSALFMVLSTMTALMICCMAMYFSVISSRSTQYAVFNQQQAYQSAVSLSDAIIAGMYGKSASVADLGNVLSEMQVGDVRTTDANGFLAFGDTAGEEEQSQAGAYMMTIERLDNEVLSDGSEVWVFDMTITSSVNGTKEVVHNIIQYDPGSTEKQQSAGPTNVFTATGYVPNDVFLDGGIMRTDVFFDNENTYLKAYSSSDLTLYGNVSCGGSLTIYSKILTAGDYPVTYAIRGNYNNKASGEIDLKSGSTVMIGGNCQGTNHFGNSNIYILGDLILDGSLSMSSKYFVNGDVIIKGHQKWVNLSNVYCNGSVDTSQMTGDSAWDHGISAPIAGTWYDANIEGVMTKEEMIEALDSKTSTNTYYKWVIDTTKLTGGTKTIEYVVDTSSGLEQKSTYYIEYGSAQDGTGCTISDITMRFNGSGNKGNAYRSLTLVIDTGDDPDNVYTVNLQGNRDWLTGEVKNETFCWFPKNTFPGSEGNSTREENGNQIDFQVLIMGRGSVLFNIPDGIIYQDDDQMKVMHYGWYVLDPANTETYIGGTTEGKTKREIIENTLYSHAFGNSAANIYPKYVHTCYDGCGCVYTEKKTTDKCSVCGSNLVQLECEDHGVVDTYCPTCEPNAKKSADCSNRVDRPKVDAYLASNASAKKRMQDSSGDVIYPNVNVFLISCDENADIRFATAATDDPKATPKQFIQNSFFGYIYAPYMTFKAVANSSTGGQFVRMAGGMTVSDYVIDDSYNFLAIWPDKIPEELMGSDSFNNPLYGSSSKSWKITLVGR